MRPWFKFESIGILLILLIGVVSANPLMSFGTQGMQMASPELAGIVSKAMCATNPTSCIVEFGKGEAMKALADTSPELAQVLNTYSKVDGYMQKGAKITSNMQFEEKGGFEEGTIQFGDESQEFGDLIGGDLKAEDISGNGVTLEKVKGSSSSKVTFDKDGSLDIKGNKFESIQSGSSVELDSKGSIVQADLTASEATSFKIGEETLDIEKGTQVKYENGVLKVLPGEDSVKWTKKGVEGVSDIDPTGEGIEIAEDEVFGSVLRGRGELDNFLDFDGKVIPGEVSGQYSLLGEDTRVLLPGQDYVVGEDSFTFGESVSVSGAERDMNSISVIESGDSTYKFTYDPVDKKSWLDLESEDLIRGAGGQNLEVGRVNLLGNGLPAHSHTFSQVGPPKEFKVSIKDAIEAYTVPDRVGGTASRMWIEKKVGGASVGFGSTDELTESRDGYHKKIETTYGAIIKF
ncbi:hypothetical protein HN935_01840 [archaeon]|jgi:hypothetical protein|nr:hypothetical protein [archaeon]